MIAPQICTPQKKNSKMFTSRKINMETKNGGLEADVPFQLSDL